MQSRGCERGSYTKLKPPLSSVPSPHTSGFTHTRTSHGRGLQGLGGGEEGGEGGDGSDPVDQARAEVPDAYPWRPR